MMYRLLSAAALCCLPALAQLPPSSLDSLSLTAEAVPANSGNASGNGAQLPDAGTILGFRLAGSENLPMQTRTPPPAVRPDLSLLRTLVRSPEEIGQAEATPIAGLYQIAIGSNVFYLSADGRYLMRGEILDLKNKINLTEHSVNSLRKQEIDKIPSNDFINYPSAGGLYRVTIFLNSDCAYCKTVHDNLAAYNRLGISVRIAAFPRGGIGSASFQRAESIWCAADRKAAFASAVNGGQLPAESCASPVHREYQTALNIGITGTPAFVLENGSVISGYIAPENLRRLLQAEEHANTL